MQVTATYMGADHNHNILLHEVEIRGDKKIEKLDHRWLNGEHANFPPDVPVGSKVRFFASPHYRRGGARLSDVRELEVI